LAATCLRRRRPGRRAAITGVIAALALFGTGATWATAELAARRAFASRAPAPEQGFVPLHERGTTVAILGDSWVSGGKLEAPLARALRRAGHGELEVVSFGHPGATSRQILRNLEADPGTPHASREVLRRRDVRYCVVIAGVNDTADFRGSDFYAHHTSEIVQALLERGIQPLVLEVPEFGLEELDGLNTRVKRAVLGRLSDAGAADPIPRYRRALRRKLDDAELLDRVPIVPFAPVVADYAESRELYKDPAHLNPAGRELLAERLAASLAVQVSHEPHGEASPDLLRTASR